MNRISLRCRITLLMGIIVLIVAFSLTLLSVHNAEDKFTRHITYAPSISMNESVIDLEDVHYFPDISVEKVPDIKLAVQAAQKQFELSSFLYMFLAMLISMLVTYLIAGKALKPVSALCDEIKGIGETNLSKRIEVPQTGDEIESLTQSFNEMLERLEQAFERQKRFSANAAHELKTPLATIKASAQVLKLDEHPSLAEYQENMDLTLQSTERMIQVVDDLLLLGKAETVMLTEQIDLAQTLKAIQDELAPVYGMKNISMKTELAIGELTGNTLLLYRAFFNLIENALKYTNPNGSITITSLYEDGEKLVRITDTGIGIAAEDIENIFEPFYRVEKSRSRKIAGSGLGLAITKEILDLHHAHVAITSKKGNGTTVEVRFMAE